MGDTLSVVVPEKVKAVGLAADMVGDAVSGDDVKVTHEIHSPFPSMGSVSVEGEKIIIDKPELFVRAAMMATNLDMYDQTNGKIRIDLTFHGLTRRIGD